MISQSYPETLHKTLKLTFICSLPPYIRLINPISKRFTTNGSFTSDQLPTWVEHSSDLVLRSNVSFLVIAYLLLPCFGYLPMTAHEWWSINPRLHHKELNFGYYTCTLVWLSISGHNKSKQHTFTLIRLQETYGAILFLVTRKWKHSEIVTRQSKYVVRFLCKIKEDFPSLFL